MDPEFEKLLNAWDEVDRCIRNLGCASIDNVGERMKDLNASRAEYADLVHSAMMAAAKK